MSKPRTIEQIRADSETQWIDETTLATLVDEAESIWICAGGLNVQATTEATKRALEYHPFNISVKWLDRARILTILHLG